MKKATAGFLFILIIFCLGCQKNVNSIEGEWKLENLSAENSAPNDASFTVAMLALTKSMPSTVLITKDKIIFKDSLNDDLEVVSYVNKENSNNLTIVKNDKKVSATFKMNGNKMDISMGEYVYQLRR